MNSTLSSKIRHPLDTRNLTSYCLERLENDTDIWYLVWSDSNDSRCLCGATFDGDSDIAGVGVVIGFILTSWITCLIAAIDTHCVISKLLNHYIRSRGAATYPLNFEKAVVELTARTRLPFILVRWGLRCALFVFCNESSVVEHFAKMTLDSLCDIQIVTSIAMITAGLVNLQTMSFYHQQIVINYWFLTLSSFWAARNGSLGSRDDSNKLHYWTRTVAVFISLVLACAYQLIIFPRQWNEWDNSKSKFCFRTNDYSIFASNYLWIAGCMMFALYIFGAIVSAIWRQDAAVTQPRPNWWRRKEKKYKRIYIRLTTALLYRLDPLSAQQSARGILPPGIASLHTETRFVEPVQSVLGLAFNLPLIILWCIHQFLDLLAWGNAGSIMLILAYVAFAAWNTWAIIDLKINNKALLNEIESNWGFGQVLPLALLGLVALMVLDNIKKAKDDQAIAVLNRRSKTWSHQDPRGSSSTMLAMV